MNKLFISCILYLNSTTLAQTVYITQTGSKYHPTLCDYLSISKISIDLSEAMSRGFRTCNRCKINSKMDTNVKTEKKTEMTTEVKKLVLIK